MGAELRFVHETRTYAAVLEEPQVHRPFVLCFKKQNPLSNCHLKFYYDNPSCAKMESKSSASVTELLQFSFSQCSEGGWQTSAFRYNCADQTIHHLCLLHTSPHLFSTPQFYQWKDLQKSLGSPQQTTAAGKAQSISTIHLT